MRFLLSGRPRLAMLAAMVVSVALVTPGAAHAFPNGNVFVSVANGGVQEWAPSGESDSLVTTLNTTLGGFTTGSTFDNAGNFYVTDFSSAAVSKFDPSGTLLGTFGSGYATPESILWNKENTAAYLGDAGSNQIKKFEPSGTLSASYTVETESRGTDWIDLNADQCTIYYTSEGSFVHSFNACTNTQGANVNAEALPGSTAYAFRKLPSTSSFDPNGYVIADEQKIAVLDSSGKLLTTYSFPGESCLFAFNLDPDGVHGWTGDFCSADVLRFNLSTGVVDNKFNTGTGGATVFGLSVKGEITSGGGGGGKPAAPLSVGYWKTHPSTGSPHASQFLPQSVGNYKGETTTQAAAIFNAMTCSNASSSSQNAIGCLAGQLLATELNVAHGSETCIAAVVSKANAWLKGTSEDGVPGVVYAGPTVTYTLTQAQRNEAITLKSALDKYNNEGGC